MVISAVCRRSVDFPAMLGPVMTCNCESGQRDTVFGVNTLPEDNRPTSTVG
jgi:hypothetical protein